MAEEKKMNIYQKMSAITQEIGTVAKNLEVGFGNNKYKAVGEADVLHAVKPIEAQYGVYSYPYSRHIVDSGEMTKGNGNKSLFLRIETVYRFVNIDNPAEYIDITTYGDGVDSQDKAPGKAMTYGDKYALLKAYKIMTGDDPDQSASEPLQGVQRKVNMPIEEEINPDQLCGDIELATLESYCRRLNWEPEKAFKRWPKVTKGQYVKAVKEMTQRIDNGNKGAA